jgi:hypothetical protein
MLIASSAGATAIDTAVGNGGGGMGMAGPSVGTTMLGGFGVELDTHNNDPSGACGESVNGDHVNVDTLTPCTVASNAILPTPIGTAVAYSLADGAWHTASLHLAAGLLTVAIKTGALTTTLFVNTPLAGFSASDAYYYGFSGATGGLSERHELRNININFPSPRCL